MRKAAVVLFFMISLAALTQGRHELDSLLRLVKKNPVADTNLAAVFNEVAYSFTRINIDSSKIYADKALALANKLNFTRGAALAYNILGIHYHMLSQFDKAINHYQKAKDLKDILGDKKGAASSQNNIGIILYLQGHYDKALATFNTSLKIQEAISDTAGLPNTLNYIASVHFLLSNYERSLGFYLKSLRLYEQTKNKQGLCQAYNNIGEIYSSLNNLDKAIENYNASLNLAFENGDKYFVISSYNNLGTVFQRKKNYVKALDYFTKSLNISRELKNTEGIANNLEKIGTLLEEENKLSEALSKYTEALSVQEKTNQIYNTAVILNSMGSVLNRLDRTSESVICYERALKIAKQLHSKNLIAQISFNYAALLKRTGNFKKAYYYLTQHDLLKDTILSDEKNKSMAEMQTRFDTDTKEKEITLLTKNKSIEELRLGEQKENIKKQKATIYVSLAGIILALSLGFFILKSYREKRKSNLLLEEKNQSIYKQKHILEEKNNLITTSIDYAKNIQKIILPDSNAFKQLLKDSFVLFAPKDVVSGDFFWIFSSENTEKQLTDKKTVYMAAIDCVGHGVPGAFMALHSYNLLERIIKGNKGISPAAILDKLNIEIIATLHQKNDNVSAKHGMDLALVKITDNVLEFSGARNPLIIVSPLLELTEVKADRMFVGGALGNFTNHTITIEKGSMIYLYTDGYADQKGGPKNEKYFSTIFKHLLESIADKSTIEQKDILGKTFYDWKGSNEQMDDVLVIGTRI